MNTINQPTRAQIQTTAMEIAARESRRLLESEQRPAYDLLGHEIVCTNPDAMPGQRNYIVVFMTDHNHPNQSFDGHSWINRPN